jgi:hypothetical protein
MVASKTIIKHESVHHSQKNIPSPSTPILQINTQYQKKLKKKPRV